MNAPTTAETILGLPVESRDAIDAHIRAVVREMLSGTSSSPSNPDVPVRFSYPRMELWETVEGIRERLRLACESEGMKAVDAQYLADLETVIQSTMQFMPQSSDACARLRARFR